jgi:ribosomal protein L37AE/L43A
MNGITVILFGIILLAFGQIVSLLNRIANALVWCQTSNSEERILVKCPKCEQELRVPKGKSGALTCPKCETQFEYLPKMRNTIRS